MSKFVMIFEKVLKQISKKGIPGNCLEVSSLASIDDTKITT